MTVLVSRFLFPQPAEHLLVPETLDCGRSESSKPASAWLIYIEWVVWKLFLPMGIAATFQRLTFYPSISLGCLRISTGTLVPIIQPHVTQSHHWKPCLATKDGQFRLRIFHYEESSLGSLRFQEVILHQTVLEWFFYAAGSIWNILDDKLLHTQKRT